MFQFADKSREEGSNSTLDAGGTLEEENAENDNTDSQVNLNLPLASLSKDSEVS